MPHWLWCDMAQSTLMKLFACVLHTMLRVAQEIILVGTVLACVLASVHDLQAKEIGALLKQVRESSMAAIKRWRQQVASPHALKPKLTKKEAVNRGP
eukprot:5880895-Amphidinium_carterae.1